MGFWKRSCNSRFGFTWRGIIDRRGKMPRLAGRTDQLVWALPILRDLGQGGLLPGLKRDDFVFLQRFSGRAFHCDDQWRAGFSFFGGRVGGDQAEPDVVTVGRGIDFFCFTVAEPHRVERVSIAWLAGRFFKTRSVSGKMGSTSPLKMIPLMLV